MSVRACIVAFLVQAAVVGAAAGAAPGTTSRSASRTVYVDGDSLAVGTGWYLPAFLHGWTVRSTTAVSRHVSQGVAAIEAAGRSLERVVVVDLGTNDDPSAVGRFRSSVREVVRAAGQSRCVIWATINRPPYDGVSYDGYNRALASLDAAYRSLHVFDWAAMARAHPGWFGPDGVHPTNAGYRARAAALARLIRSC